MVIKLSHILLTTLQSGIDVPPPPPTIFFSKNAYHDILIGTPRLLSLSIDEIVRPRHNSNAIDRVIACVTMYDCKVYGKMTPVNV